ncbi:MAG: dihydropteroate synthase [Pirellulaceae bacterium]|nr:dihydropteroate synthase [Pirellulaceae bacterium]
MTREHLHFVTGRLAEHALRKEVEALSTKVGFEASIGVLPITVAALMTPTWIARHIQAPRNSTKIIIPGYCEGDVTPIAEAAKVPVQRGPRDLRQLGELFGETDARKAGYGGYDIEILAEINHAPRLTLEQIRAEANQLRANGADLIDVGCEPGGTWSGVADCVKMLRDDGHRVSIDSLDPGEIAPAVKAGAELVLSVNATNRDAALDWGCEVVVIPDDFATLGGLEETVEQLALAKVPLRIDPILEPIGFGFAASLARYMEVRRLFPDAEMLMGIGNLTELTDVDSAGVNVLLLAICQELGIRSVLTTQVINWARSSVKECDLARRLVYHSIRQHVPPKHLEPNLVLLRDPKLLEFGQNELDLLAGQIKDNSYRVFAENGQVHLVGRQLHLSNADPFLVFERLMNPGFGGATDSHHSPRNLDASHAFYLGYEMAKAATALTLGKQYRQDESLDWGFLTREEVSHRLRKGAG